MPGKEPFKLNIYGPKVPQSSISHCKLAVLALPYNLLVIPHLVAQQCIFWCCA